MKYFVFCNDFFSGDHCAEMRGFDNIEEAVLFINNRIRGSDHGDVADYRIVKGHEMRLSAVEIVKSVKVG